MIDRVRRAFDPDGFLNALTPFEIASRPVSDEPPLAKALSRTKIAERRQDRVVLVDDVDHAGRWSPYRGRSPKISRMTPTTTTRPAEPTKK